MDLLGKLKGEIDVIHEGIPLATVKGRDLIPSPAACTLPASLAVGISYSRYQP